MKLLLAFYLEILCTFSLINSDRSVIDTPNKLQYQFFPVSGACVNFKVRAPNDAHLCLTAGPEEADPMTETFIGGWSNTKSVIRKNRQKPDVIEVSTPGILDAGEFRGFWIKWNSSVVTVGREGEAAAFMSHEDPNLHPINFVGISTGWGASGSWIIDDCPVPSTTPKIDSVEFVTPQTGNETGYWVPAAGGEIPPEAVQGGFDGEEIYIGRAKNGGALIPGKLVPSHGVCYVPWGGQEHAHQEYEVLCSANGTWVPANDGQIPPSAIPGGETEEGEPLYIGRAKHNGTLTVGKVQPSQNACYIPYGGQELAYENFDVLIA